MKCAHRKRGFPNTGRDRDEHVKSDCERQPSVLEVVPSKMLGHEDAFPGSAEEALTVLEEEEKGMSKRILRILFEFAEIILRIAKKEDKRLALQLVFFVANRPPETSIFKRYIKKPADYEAAASEITRNVMKDDEFSRLLTNGGASLQSKTTATQ